MVMKMDTMMTMMMKLDVSLVLVSPGPLPLHPLPCHLLL